jgi:FkbM family methyltransferase
MDSTAQAARSAADATSRFGAELANTRADLLAAQDQVSAALLTSLHGYHRDEMEQATKHHEHLAALAELQHADQTTQAQLHHGDQTTTAQLHHDHLVALVELQHADQTSQAQLHHEHVGAIAEQVGTSTDRGAAELRALAEALDRNHKDTWDSDRALHDTVMRRLASVERAVNQTGRIPPDQTTQGGDADSIRHQLTTFLNTQNGSNTELISTNEMQFEIPSWDTVILPYVREHGDWEPEVLDVLLNHARPGATVLDVGAHVGLFTCQLARAVGTDGRVIAVEADPINASVLQRNIHRNALGNVYVVGAAASDRTGPVSMSRSVEENTGDSRAYEVPTAGDITVVQGFAIDELLPGDVDLIKLDLQGMDHAAIRGMQKLIGRCHPTIVTEFWPAAIEAFGDDPVEIWEYYGSLGYEWTAVQDAMISSGASPDATISAIRDRPTGFVDLLMTPRE